MMIRPRDTGARWAGGIAALSVLAAPIGVAQTDAETLADLRACSTLERDRARLACFDGVLGSPSAEPDAAAAAPVAPPVPESAAVQPARNAAVEPARNAAVAPARSAAVETAPGPRAASAAESAPAPAPPESPATLRAAAPSRLGAAPPQAQAEPVPDTVTIVDVNTDLGPARFTTSGGYVLIQTTGGEPRGGYPEVPFEATLDDGLLGSLFLTVGERRRVRVRVAE